ncbi:MAG: hypothetical protein COW85_15070 [Ignavibacteria bacterium CG22_combo_CG10-13_8_21_14_all_37_15]|nr:MAG: hypothetical protein COW85_15070 [Ignavibacteria bacterium CG22_combo_CG10-13_8_21_14_all_37_15]
MNSKIFCYLKSKKIFCFLVLIFTLPAAAQTLESQTAQVKLGRIWGGVTANGDQATFDFRSGFFPNDYDILHYRGQYNDNFFGSGFKLAATGWLAPTQKDSIYNVAVFGPKNDFYPTGKVIVPITNYLRYKYPNQIIDNKSVGITDFGVYDPLQFTDGTFDQKIEGTYLNVLGVEVKRKIMVWSQNYNDNYVIIDAEFSNVGYTKKTASGGDSLILDTLKNFHISLQQAMGNNYYSVGSSPPPQTSERPNYTNVWQHYYGGRPGDSLRVFYFYSADDPTSAGDNMGSPVVTQQGRLLNTNFTFYTILHASKEPYTNVAQDVDDFLQPKVTYIGNETKFPSPDAGEDEFGSKNFWAIRGGLSDRDSLPGRIPGTHHGINNDELGTADFSNFTSGTTSSNNSRNFSSFGPYTFLPNQKIRIVYACGFTGIGYEKAQEIGGKWLSGTLEDPPNMPNPQTGWLPSNFAFPQNATEQDERKDRWISMGIDSVMLAAFRAKWNFQNNYLIPQAPPPPDYLQISGYGEGVEIKWSDAAAEAMPNFEGYRIMRKVSNADSIFYQEIYSSGSDDKAVEHLYMDKSILVGAQYYYYLQAKAKIAADDLTADPFSRGKMMYSNRVYIPNVSFINPPRFSQNDMSRIRIAPNPYNINDPLLRTYGYTDGRGINFFNLPPEVTVKIFSENGDLVQSIEHHPVEKSGSFTWDMITSSQQVISSGIYIAVFQKPSGEISYQKFIVVR